MTEVRGAALRELVAEHARRLALERHGGALRAIVLTGSVARDEGTVAPAGGRARVLGDAELFLVFRDGAAVPGRDSLRALSASVEEALEKSAGVSCRVDLSPVFAGYFRSLPPSIFACELRACGKVIWGEDVLRLVPAWGAGEIPREDAFRLLWNRVIELLGALGGAGGAPDAGYGAAKLYLDMATSLLVFAGRYQPTYRARRDALRRWAEDGGADWPFPAAGFVERVDRATAWKLCGEEMAGAEELCAAALGDARALSSWELTRLTGRAAAGEGELWAAWRRRQPAAGRLRGWLYVVRARGWHRSWRSWPRWLRQAAGGSPRALIYAAAFELISHPEWPEEAGGGARVLAALPCAAAPEGRDDLCRDVYRNYKEFLVGTRC